MLPSYYEFYNSVKIASGNKALENIPYELGQLGANRPLILTDQGVAKAGLTKLVIDSFAGSNVTIGAVYDSIPVDSSHLVVNQIAEIYRQKSCDSIIAVGGGSVIDTAKGVNIVVTEGSNDLLEFMGNNRLTKPMKPFIVVPTTGTGSEVTAAAVIMNTEKQTKMQFTSPYMLPKLAILDPRMTETMPPKITAATALDALTHAIEAFMGTQKNPISDAFATAAIVLIRDNIQNVLKNGKDKDSRLAMANAALLAGIAFSNSMVGCVHALAHALGGVCHVPHGIGNGIMLPHGMEYNLDAVPEHIAGLLLPLVGEERYVEIPPANRALEAIAAVRALSSMLEQATGIPLRLKDAGVPEDKLESIAKVAINDGAIAFNPKAMDFDDALRMLRAAY
ncbi:MAG: iron-containing alcohol dehydrogenase [Deltaproteobacteria bacterium]|nr:iron-containing alcohol dehydrogenase [Deltaproteobacteria bacterium]